VRLKKVVIQGFKSFMGKTVVRFDGGIIAVVGPNGCGKSNIADAFRWVLGEQSAKSMRSQKMQDVIFSGTSDAKGNVKRKPLNFAEVTICLSEVEGTLATDYEEVEITRRLYRSGESNYFINRHPARLKDIHDLLAGSGIGKNAFSIFEQGKIDQVIYLNPEERRSIFEEVAGTAFFLKRKQETLRRLNHTEQNLLRLRDILSEVKKQKELSEKQAEKAMLFQEKKQAFEELDKQLLYSRWTEAHQRLDDNTAQLETQQRIMEETSKSVKSLHQEAHEAKQLLEEREKVLQNKRESFYEVRNRRDLKIETSRLNEEKRVEAVERIEKLVRESGELEKKKSAYALEIEEKGKEQRTLDERLEKEVESLRIDRLETKNFEMEVAALRENQVAQHRERVRLLQLESRLEGELKQTKVRYENAEEQLKQNRFQVETSDEIIEKSSSAVKGVAETMASVSKAVDEKKAGKAALTEELHTLEETLKHTEQELQGERENLSELSARQQALVRLREEMQGFSQGTKQLLQESQKEGSPLFGRIRGLFELFAPEVERKSALTVAMRPYAQTLVVKNREDFQTVAAFAEEKGIKDFSLLNEENLTETSLTDTFPPLISKKENNRFIRHFLSHIYLADGPEQALNASAPSAAFATGEAYIDRCRVVFFPSKKQTNIFEREAELKNLKKEIAEKRGAIELLSTKHGEEKQEKEHLASKVQEQETLLRKEEMRLVEVNFSLQRTKNDLETVKAEKEKVVEDSTKIEENLEGFQKKLQELSQAFEKAKKEAEENQKSHVDLEDDLVKKQSLYQEKKDVLGEKETAYQELIDQSQKLAYELNLLMMRKSECGGQLEKIEKEIESYRSMQEKLSTGEETSGEDLLQLSEKVKAFSAACDAEEKEVLVLKEKVEELQQKLEEEHVREVAAMEKKSSFDVSVSEARSTCTALEHELDERYQLKMDDPLFEEMPLLEHLSNEEKQLKSLRRQLESLGNVNMTAIDEKEAHQERFETLSRQIEDLESSKEELLEIITELESETRTLLLEAFEQIREHFKKNFEILFRGGEADLKLVGDEDILNAGVEIIAKPPGKQMRSIQLLSGGEKCLTAMALLFAIFEFKPAPFCLLDEIDAPLDDSNIERFVNVLQQFIDHCQFVIITHNKRTMAIADRIYGVTMEEKGVSKLLSLEFKDEHVRKTEPRLVEA